MAEMNALERAGVRQEMANSPSQSDEQIRIWTKAMSPILRDSNEKNVNRFTNMMQSKDKEGGTRL